jgi:hypothetical protein
MLELATGCQEISLIVDRASGTVARLVTFGRSERGVVGEDATVEHHPAAAVAQSSSLYVYKGDVNVLFLSRHVAAENAIGGEQCPPGIEDRTAAGEATARLGFISCEVTFEGNVSEEDAAARIEEPRARARMSFGDG